MPFDKFEMKCFPQIPEGLNPKTKVIFEASIKFCIGGAQNPIFGACKVGRVNRVRDVKLLECPTLGRSLLFSFLKVAPKVLLFFNFGEFN